MQTTKTQNIIGLRSVLLVVLFVICSLNIIVHGTNLVQLVVPEAQAESKLDLAQFSAIYFIALVILSFLNYYRFKSALTPFFNYVLPSPKRRHLILCQFQE